jgi:hypothetical protein
VVSRTCPVAFFITVATPIPMIEKFCVHMGIAVICNFVALVTLFGPCMVWDVRRRVAGRLDVCLCIVVPITPPAAVHTSLSPESNTSNNVRGVMECAAACVCLLCVGFCSCSLVSPP